MLKEPQSEWQRASPAPPPRPQPLDTCRLCLDLGPRANGAAQAGAAEAAVAVRHFGQVLLVVVLRKIEGRRVEDFSRDRSVAVGRQNFLISGLGGFSRSPLRVRGNIN